MYESRGAKRLNFTYLPVRGKFACRGVIRLHSILPSMNLLSFVKYHRHFGRWRLVDYGPASVSTSDRCESKENYQIVSKEGGKPKSLSVSIFNVH